MTTFLRTLPRRLASPLAVAALGLLAAAAPLRAAEQNPDLDIHFGVKAGVDLGATFKLRPTLQQPLFIFVLNNTDKPVDDVTVELLADGAPVEGTVQHVAVEAKSRVQVVFGKPAAPPPPAPPAPGAPPAKPQPPTLQEVKGALQVAVLDKDGKKKLATADLPVARPEDYVQVTAVSYNTEPKSGEPKNTFIVHLKGLGGFGGPASHVELVVGRDGIPDLIDSPHKEGTRSGYLGPTGELTLKAENLEFEGGVATSGLVYLTVDGWERAFTFYTTFPTSGGQAGIPTQVQNIPTVRLVAPEAANPGAPLPVTVQLDLNGPVAGQKVALAFDRGNDQTYSEENGDLVMFPGDRDVRMLVGVSPEGALLLQPQVQDWKKTWDVSNVFGSRTLQVQVLTKNGTPVKDGIYDVEDVTRKDWTRVRSFEQWKTKPAVVKTVRLDAAPPEGITFTFPASLNRGADLPVQAWSADDLKKHEDIKQVFFYIGRPGPDGAPPPTALKVAGKWDEKIKKWTAVLPAPPAPTDLKGKVDVTATFVKTTDVPANGTVTVQLVDPAAAGAAAVPKGAHIAGTVVEGGLPQPGLEVRLQDDKGVLKDSVKANAKGEYLFLDVPAGSYQVTSAKGPDSTRGATAVTVVDGKNRDGVDVNLQR